MGGTNNIPDPELKETPWGERYRKELEGAYDTNLEMTDFERAGLQSLQAGVAGNLPDIYKTGRRAISEVASGGTDVMTSPLYRGLRQELEREQADMISDVKRMGQSGGMLRSTPTARAVGDTSAQFANQRLSLLGQLIDRNQGRQMSAANRATQLGEFEGSTMPQALLQWGGLPRQIEAQNLARNRSIAESLMGYQPWYQPAYQTGGSQWGGAAQGALSGAAQGAAIGSAVPGIGTAVGAGAGTIIGGVGGWFS